jgi:hypothetical protein
MLGRDKVHSTHSFIGCITGAMGRGFDVGDNFRNLGGLRHGVGRQTPEILQKCVGVAGDAHPMSASCFVFQRFLQRQKQPDNLWNNHCHGA